MFVVIDTNIIVSALLKSNSNPRTILDFVFKRKLIPVVNEAILKEYKEVLKRKKFNFETTLINLLFEELKPLWKYIEAPIIKVDNCDKNDLVFYSIYKKQSEIIETYLITGNLKHFPTEKNIISPKMMVDIIKNGN